MTASTANQNVIRGWIVPVEARSYFWWNRPTGRLPIPRHLAAACRSLCELRQQLWNPRRVDCLGFFFVAASSLIHGLNYCA